MAIATYRFIVPGRYIGQTVTVFYQATNAQVASGAVGSDGVYSVALTQGDYYATTPDGRYVDADQSGSPDSDSANTAKAQQVRVLQGSSSGYPVRGQGSSPVNFRGPTVPTDLAVGDTFFDISGAGIGA